MAHGIRKPPRSHRDGAEAESATEARLAAERRRAQRVLVNLEVDYASEDTYLFANITDISATGIFIRTLDIKPPGTRLNLRFTPPARIAHELGRIEVEGEVMWVNPHRPGARDSLHPGMGLRFVDVAEPQRHLLETLVRRIAYFDQPGPAAESDANAEPDRES